MSFAGSAFLIIALVATALSVGLLLVGQVWATQSAKNDSTKKTLLNSKAQAVGHFGRLAALLGAMALTAACLVMVICFMTGDVSILYVLQNRSLSTGGFAWLFKLSGLWASRAGSLLFWAFLIAAFAVVLVVHTRNLRERLDDAALTVVQAVLLAFVGILVFSSDYQPFAPTPPNMFTETGALTASASVYHMNHLLEHWAMAIHPPTLFLGYAGLTVPFAYAIGALIVNDPSKLWVERATRYVLFSWLLLGAGIGLGAVWAYVCLGWGGYWGWDPVENASLLSWLICVALAHTFTVYRQRGAFKRWGIMCACLSFTFVIVATFITRSGIVQSVHSFQGDPVSLVLFGGLIVVSLVVAIVGLIIRWKSFTADTEGGDDVENMLSKDAAYYFNNVIMVVFALLLVYMTVSAALPTWLPFGGDTLAKTAYEAIARPLGIFYLLIMAVGPMFSWTHTDPKKFLRQARVPGICALVAFAGLIAYWATNLRPAYYAMLAKGDTNAQTLLEAGPTWYYDGLAVVGLLVACLLFFNALFMLVRGVRGWARAHDASPLAGVAGMFRTHASAFGGFITHMGMAVVLVGLIGSSMYVTQESGYVAYDEATNTASNELKIQEYRLVFADRAIVDTIDVDGMYTYEVTFDVYRGDAYVGQVNPQMQIDANTMQRFTNASVLSFADEDLFVTYRGDNATTGAMGFDVFVNPLMTPLWTGFFMLMLGTFLSIVGGRSPQEARARKTRVDAGADAAADAEDKDSE